MSKIIQYKEELYDFESLIWMSKDNNLKKFIDENDEVHLLDTPEIIYPFIDAAEKFILLATNQSFKLNEALKNRCINLIFSPYTQSELREIVKQSPFLEGKNNDYLDLIIQAGENNPRRIKNLCIRLCTIFNFYGVPHDTNSLQEILSTILNIKEGLNPQEQDYMRLISRLGTASLETLSSILGYDKTTIKFEIEPSLLYNQLIKISSKGRMFNEHNTSL